MSEATSAYLAIPSLLMLCAGAVPMRILDLMQVDGLTREHVASHLQVIYCKILPGRSALLVQISRWSPFHSHRALQMLAWPGPRALPLRLAFLSSPRVLQMSCLSGFQSATHNNHQCNSTFLSSYNSPLSSASSIQSFHSSNDI